MNAVNDLMATSSEMGILEVNVEAKLKASVVGIVCNPTATSFLLHLLISYIFILKSLYIIDVSWEDGTGSNLGQCHRFSVDA